VSLRCASGMTDAMYNWRVVGVHNALREMGKETGALNVEDLTNLGHLDQYHYLGVEATDHLIDVLGVDSQARVLDVGSGIGGPARYIAAKTGCSLDAIELQADLNSAAADLTARCGLQERVKYITGDIIALSEAGEITPDQYSHFISLLVFLHIPDRTRLLEACFKAVQPGATFLIEDFMALGPFTAQEKSWLSDVVSAPTVTSAEEYHAALEAAGFVDIQFVDLSEIWQRWTKARHDLFVESKEETLKMHGEKVFTSRASFYKVIDDLFAGGNLGGCRITGRKPGALEAKLIEGRKKDQSSGVSIVNVVEGKPWMSS